LPPSTTDPASGTDVSAQRGKTIGLVRRGYSASGGAERYLLRLAAQLRAADRDVVLFSDVVWPETSVRQVRVPASDPMTFADNLARILPGHPCEILFSFERIHSCDVYRAGDGVHAAWLAQRLRYQSPVARLFRWVNRKHRRLLRLESALFTGGARHVIANSRMVKREIIEHYGCPEDRIHLVYNGVPANVAVPGSRAELRRELGLEPDDYVALFVGSGWERKGLRFAWEAAWKVEGLRLLIAGKDRIRFKPHIAPGPGEHPYEAIPQRFLGPRTDIPRLLAAADVFILPTIYDPFSNACLEALGAGLPVITTRANGFAEIVEDGLHGTIVDRPDDLPALIAALELWRDAGQRESTRTARLQRAAEYSMERNVRETMAVLDLLGES
jgi:UDP-glucose:(heptosyl)LPS alpha-1,3-glucosyltransferase